MSKDIDSALLMLPLATTIAGAHVSDTYAVAVIVLIAMAIPFFRGMWLLFKTIVDINNEAD